MTQDEYMEGLQRKFERNFDIEKDIIILGEKIDFRAKFCNISGRTFITKNDVIDRCENYELCYIKRFDNVTEEGVAVYGQFLKKIVDEFVKPGVDHMSTYVTGVVVGGSVNENAKNSVRKYNYNKAYSFYLRGWCDVRLICVDLNNNEVITNKAGKRVQKVYQITPGNMKAYIGIF